MKLEKFVKLKRPVLFNSCLSVYWSLNKEIMSRERFAVHCTFSATLVLRETDPLENLQGVDYKVGLSIISLELSPQHNKAPQGLKCIRLLLKIKVSFFKFGCTFTSTTPNIQKQWFMSVIPPSLKGTVTIGTLKGWCWFWNGQLSPLNSIQRRHQIRVQFISIVQLFRQQRRKFFCSMIEQNLSEHFLLDHDTSDCHLNPLLDSFLASKQRKWRLYSLPPKNLRSSKNDYNYWQKLGFMRLIRNNGIFSQF